MEIKQLGPKLSVHVTREYDDDDDNYGGISALMAVVGILGKGDTAVAKALMEKGTHREEAEGSGFKEKDNTHNLLI